MGNLAIALVGLAGVALGSLLQRHSDQRRWLHEQRIKVFAEVHAAFAQGVRAAAHYASSGSEAARSEAQAAITEALARLDAVAGYVELVGGERTPMFPNELVLNLAEVGSAVTNETPDSFEKGWYVTCVYTLECTRHEWESASWSIQGLQDDFLKAARAEIGNTDSVRRRVRRFIAGKKFKRAMREVQRGLKEVDAAGAPVNDGSARGEVPD